EDPFVDVALRCEYLHLVADTSQKCIVDQFLRIQVRREDNQLLERYLNLLTACHGQEVMPVFQGQNPPVEEFLRTDDLPSEVVDQENAAVGLEVDRGLVKVRVGIVPQVEH